MGSLVDLFTFVPHYLNGPSGYFNVYPRTTYDNIWISLDYLRVWRAGIAYERLENVGNLEDIPLLLRRAFLLTLKSCAMIITMSGTMLTLEVLGEIPTFEDGAANH